MSLARTRAIIEAKRLTLTRQERHEFAAMLVGHEGSWESLDEDDARRIADALNGFLIVQTLLQQRRSTFHTNNAKEAHRGEARQA